MPDDRPPSAADAPGEGVRDEIVCHTTAWYFRRMGLLVLMLAGLGAWFAYDGLVNYPRKIAIYEEYEAITERRDIYEALELEGRLADWPRVAEARGWPADEPVEWVVYSDERGWKEEPDKKLPGDDREQLFWAGGMGVFALVVITIFLLNRSRTLRADGVSLTTPGGRRVAFADVFRVDKRKWKHKGLAYVHYRPEGSKVPRRAVIDDLKFGGAEAVLDRVLTRFEGELIDRVDEGDEDLEPVGEERSAEVHATGDAPADGGGKS